MWDCLKKNSAPVNWWLNLLQTYCPSTTHLDMLKCLWSFAGIQSLMVHYLSPTSFQDAIHLILMNGLMVFLCHFIELYTRTEIKTCYGLLVMVFKETLLHGMLWSYVASILQVMPAVEHHQKCAVLNDLIYKLTQFMIVYFKLTHAMASLSSSEGNFTLLESSSWKIPKRTRYVISMQYEWEEGCLITR